jgi:hypothetical protein
MLLIYLVGTSSNCHKTLLGGHLLGDLGSAGALHVFVIGALLDTLYLFSEDEFNVSGLTGVLANSSMGTVGTTASGGGTVALGVADIQEFRVKTLGLAIGNGIREQVPVDTHGLDGPASLGSSHLELLGLCLASTSTRVPHKGHDRLEGQDIIKKLERLIHWHATRVVRNLPAVLKMDPQV